MTPEERQQLDEHLAGIAEILAKNTSTDDLKDFETIEVTIREHLLTTVGPSIGSFFLNSLQKQQRGE